MQDTEAINIKLLRIILHSFFNAKSLKSGFYIYSAL